MVKCSSRKAIPIKLVLYISKEKMRKVDTVDYNKFPRKLCSSSLEDIYLLGTITLEIYFSNVLRIYSLFVFNEKYFCKE